MGRARAPYALKSDCETLATISLDQRHYSRAGNPRLDMVYAERCKHFSDEFCYPIDSEAEFRVLTKMLPPACHFLLNIFEFLAPSISAPHVSKPRALGADGSLVFSATHSASRRTALSQK